ncbi:MAG TPA: hypothetical protein DCK87_08860 [Desulfotomaculum sp.]|nr:hypothetical protein [Desulfotomaculum sp.]
MEQGGVLGSIAEAGQAIGVGLPLWPAQTRRPETPCQGWQRVHKAIRQTGGLRRLFYNTIGDIFSS